jgi:methenyltetrahydrofolate cyclohydrolase
MKLSMLTVQDFVNALASKTPTPGGGSAAAASGAMGLGLLLMVASYAELDANNEVEAKLKQLSAELIDLIDQDAASFDAYMEAMRLPKENDEEKALRRQAMQKAIQYAAAVPLQTLKACYEASKYFDQLSEVCKKSMISDLGSASSLLRTSVEGAYLNILINAASIKDENFVNNMLNDARAMKQACLAHFSTCLQSVEQELAFP